MMFYSTDPRAPADLERVLERALGAHPHVRDITRAVEAYLGDGPGQPLLATDHALWHAARALAAVGQAQAANAVLSLTSQMAGWSGQIDCGQLPPATTRLLSSGLIKATDSPVLGPGVLVQMDLRLVPVEPLALELVYIPVAHRLVDACIPLWSRSHGQGALLVRGLHAHTGSGVAGRPRSTPRGAWLRDAFQHRLAWWAEREGWARAPWLVQAD